MAQKELLGTSPVRSRPRFPFLSALITMIIVIVGCVSWVVFNDRQDKYYWCSVVADMPETYPETMLFIYTRVGVRPIGQELDDGEWFYRVITEQKLGEAIHLDFNCYSAASEAEALADQKRDIDSVSEFIQSAVLPTFKPIGSEGFQLP